MKPHVKERCADPGAFYRNAEDVMADENLSVDEKEYILKTMAFDAEVLNDSTTEDRAPGEHPADLAAIHKALNELTEADTPESHAADLGWTGQPCFSRVVAALSGNDENDRGVLEMTASVIRLSGGDAAFVSVVERKHTAAAHAGAISPVGGAVIAPEIEPDIEELVSRRKGRLREMLRSLSAPPSHYHLEVRVGQVDKEVLEAAQDLSADLIVVGAHDRSWFEGLFSSETAHRIATAATCPVLIVPERARE